MQTITLSIPHLFHKKATAHDTFDFPSLINKSIRDHENVRLEDEGLGIDIEYHRESDTGFRLRRFAKQYEIDEIM